MLISYFDSFGASCPALMRCLSCDHEQKVSVCNQMGGISDSIPVLTCSSSRVDQVIF
ncbi:uncharacterized protein BDW70DRAFT_57694 [Aspergillus foveolatus]|uniref:uncharacterized protein n=1 Tax=Aspergillus foveolatus TaxID=210207 RepID=UPI003CCCACFC